MNILLFLVTDLLGEMKQCIDMGKRSILPAAIALLFLTSTGKSQVYDVRKYGASGGGSSDITQVREHL